MSQLSLLADLGSAASRAHVDTVRGVVPPLEAALGAACAGVGGRVASLHTKDTLQAVLGRASPIGRRAALGWRTKSGMRRSVRPCAGA